MKRLLIICQKVDESDDLLGFFASWIREFAKHYEKMTVIALGAGQAQLPDNVTVYSLGKESGVPRWRRWFGVLNLLRREVKRHDAVFCHMSPIFAIVSWPFTRAWHKKLVLWYLHRANTFRLRLALRIVDALVTADTRSLTIQSQKIHAVGHGIDVERFEYPERQPPTGRPLRILSVGRLSPIKGFETLIRAAAKLRERDVDGEVRIVGKAVMAGDHQYEEQLHALVSRLGVGNIVHFFGFVPHQDMPAHYRRADIVVGCTPPGGIDKVLLEAMAAGCVVFTSNAIMDVHLGQSPERFLFPHADAPKLTSLIEAMDDWTTMQKRFVSEVRAHHDVHQAIERIVSIIDESRAS